MLKELLQAKNEVKNIVSHLFWSLLLQGIVCIVFAVLIIVQPMLLVALASALLLVLGIMLLIMAAKVRALWRKVPDFLK